ncbi:acyl-coenzyme A thioesterase THEM4-like isoform X2 [Branchiostoma floridae x Branchiostoma japonicum]
MALRNCILSSTRALDSIFGAKVENFLQTRRLLYSCFLKVTQAQVQVGSPSFLKEPSQVLSTGYSFSWRGLATETAERKDGQHLGKTNEEEPFIDVAWPNEAWSDITKEIFHQLNAGTENGDWKRHPGYLRTGERRLYSRNISEQGKGFEYAVFINKREQRATCVCQFGPYLEGPPSPVPLGSTAIFRAKVDRQQDRKAYLSAYVTSADRRTTLCDATSLFVKLSQEQMEKAKKYLPQDSNSDKVMKAEKSVV